MNKKKVVEKEKPPISREAIEDMTLLKAFQTHDKLIDQNLSITTDLAQSMYALQRNMKGINEVIQSMMSYMDGINGVLRTIVERTGR